MLDKDIRKRLEEAFNIKSAQLYRKLENLAQDIAGDHIEYMKNNSKAIDRKITQSLYVGKRIKNKDARIIDFGSGCGFLSCVLAATGAEYVVGVEIAEPRIKVGKFLSKEVFRIQNVDFISSAESLPPESFDAALLINSISHIQEPLKVLLSIKQLLKKYGLLFIEDNNNYESFIIRRRLKNHVWPGEGLDGEHVYRPMRLEYIKTLHPNIQECEALFLADETYGLNYSETKSFVNYWQEHKKKPFDNKQLKRYAPVNPARGSYQENALRPRELETILFNLGLVPIGYNSKYIFDFKKNWFVSFIFKSFHRLSLKISPGYEILAVKK
jgi:SAM-dependent methyltransferase